MPPAGLARYSVPSTITPFQSITLPPGWLHSFLPVRRLTPHPDTLTESTGTTPLATMRGAPTRPRPCRHACLAPTPLTPPRPFGSLRGAFYPARCNGVAADAARGQPERERPGHPPEAPLRRSVGRGPRPAAERSGRRGQPPSAMC